MRSPLFKRFAVLGRFTIVRVCRHAKAKCLLDLTDVKDKGLPNVLCLFFICFKINKIMKNSQDAVFKKRMLRTRLSSVFFF